MRIFEIKKDDIRNRYYFCGIKVFSYQSKTRQIKKYLKQTSQNQQRILRKMSMVDDTWRINNVNFYVPNYPYDYVQSQIVNNNQFYEQTILEELDSYIPNAATILDIGANIGNHSLYWTKIHNAQKIHAFEPIRATFKILMKNIEINSLDGVIIPHNIGLSDESIKASVASFNAANIGGTSLQKNTAGDLVLERLDDMDLQCEHIDFVKIDVEGHELSALQGMVKTIAQYKPKIFIESFPECYPAIDAFFKAHNYVLEKTFPDSNFLYVHK